MVIEYNGTVLRNEVAIRKEKTYTAQVRSREPQPSRSGHWYEAKTATALIEALIVF